MCIIIRIAVIHHRGQRTHLHGSALCPECKKKLGPVHVFGGFQADGIPALTYKLQEQVGLSVLRSTLVSEVL